MPVEVTISVSTIIFVARCRWCGRVVTEGEGEVRRLRGTCPFRDCKLVSEFVIQSRE